MNQLEPFGSRTWDDVRSAILKSVRRKWPNMPIDDVEDAVSEAIVDLVDYWLHLSSSVDISNPERNFAFGIRRGAWVATTALVARFNEYEHEWPTPDGATDDGDGGTVAGLLARHPDDGLGPEDAYIEREKLECLRDAISRLTPDDWEQWFDDYIEGKTTREIASDQGISQSKASRRQREGLALLRGAA